MEAFKTRKFIMKLADISDLSDLKEIDKECGEYFAFDPQCGKNHSCSLEECLTTGDIPPGVEKERFIRGNYFFYCIWQGDTLIGFISYYIEYKKMDAVYLSTLYVKEAYRGGGAGTEIIEALTARLAASGFAEIRLHCSLRNATALRFWVKNGFDRIAAVECDGNLYPENFAGIELIKTIRK